MTQLKLTKQQDELWYAYKLNPNSDNYNIAVSYRVRGDFDKEKFKLIYLTIGNHFEAFRTQFIENDEEAAQIIRDHFDGELIYQTLNDATEQKVLDTIEALRAKPFSLEKDWLFRAILIKADNQTYYFQFVWHHIISDGLTTTIFSKAFEKLYNDGLEAIKQFNTYPLADYLQYEASIIANKKKETIDYWQNYLKGCQQNELAKYTHDDTGKINRKRLNIDSKSLKNLLKTHKTTPFIFFNALISTFIFRCFHLTDIVLSYPKNIRPNEFAKIVGYFVSMFPMRVQLSADMTFAGLLYNIKKQYKEDRNYQEIAFEEIRKNLNHNFQPNITLVEACMASPEINTIDLDYSNAGTYYGQAKTILFAYENAYNSYEISYNENYIPSYFIEYFENLINEVLTNTDKKLSDYELMSIDQKRKLLYDWNKTDKSYPKNKTIHQLFEEQAAKHPNNIAVVFENKQLSYGQLNAKANQLARYLRSITPIHPDTLIAIALNKSLEMIIGILGILKSGAAYVTIDPSYPDERIKYILDDTQASLVLSQSQYVSRLASISTSNIIAVDSDCYTSLPIDNLKPINTANDLAYVIYTSGTTGQPKGVLQNHYNVFRLFAATNHQFQFTHDDTWVLYHNYVFDFSVWELWGAFLFGGKLIIPNGTQRHDVKALCKFILNNKVTILNQTPAVFYNLLEFISNNHSHFLENLRYIIFGGDKLNFNKLNQYFNFANNRNLKTKLVNMYGITEITVHATFKEIHAKDCEQSSSIIGAPLSDMQCYVLNQHGEPVVIGSIGELHIGGAGLARGYLNKPELTAEKFIPNPFATETDKANGCDRLYKTGDLVRWLPDGNLEYIGRKDKQVKIRGFRIELAEIENTLINITGIQQAVAINRVVNDEQYLFAYYTANEQINPELIIDKITNKLPHYMMPTAVLQINEIPLTINGKIDINALPEIRFESTQAYIEPRTEQERIVCQAFSNLLLIEKIGIDDNFFKLGGNSIKAIQLAMILQSNFEIDVAEIFDLRTPRKLAHNKRITHDPLIFKLKQIKRGYTKENAKGNKMLNSELLLKKEQYLSSIANMSAIKYTAKPINNVLLTGATGFLGCNLLNQLLTLTPYRIYLCIRAKNKTHAIERMAHKYQFYFDMSLEDQFPHRIVYIPCDLEKRQIGVSDEQYHQLTQNIDSIIHCAALAKHYGIEQVFYNANVTSTINLLKLCELTRLKDFHYISTYSVMTGVTNDSETVLTEDDQLNINGEWNSPYTKTKYLGEINTIKWREKGINSSVYRVGNLAFMQHNGKLQEDVKDNAFATYITFIRKLGCIADNMNEGEISPADLTATAIVKMFDKQQLNNQTHHVFNPNKIKLSQIRSAKNQKIKVVTFGSFIDSLITYLQHNNDCDLIGRFLLRMGWQSDTKKSHFNIISNTTILQSKTEAIFKMINFEWSVINDQQLKAYVKKLDKIFDVALDKPIPMPQHSKIKRWLATPDSMVNTIKLKAIKLIKEHKRIVSIISGLLFIAPLLYVLEILDIIAVLEIFDGIA